MFAFLFPRSRAEQLVCALVIVVTAVAYAPLAENTFLTFDDGVYLTWNGNVQQGLGARSVRWAFSSTSAHNWHPLTWISHIVDWQLWGNRAAGHHLVNLSLHIASAIVLFLALERLTTFSTEDSTRAKRRRGGTAIAPATLWPSAVVALLFAIHPLHVESVAWAAERKDVLCGLFFWLALAAYGYYATQPSGPRYLLVTFFFVLGLMSKPMIVTLPLVLLLLDFWPLGRWTTSSNSTASAWRTTWRLFREKLPWIALSIASCAVTYYAQAAGGATTMLDPIPLPQRLANAAWGATAYLRQTFWPTGLCCFYPYPAWLLGDEGGLRPAALAAMGFIVAATIVALVLARHRRYVLVGWLWYLLTLAPVLGLIQVGKQARADRYTYVPLEGIFIVLAWGGWELAARLPAMARRWSVLCVAVVIAALAVTTWRQVGYWHDDVSVFSRAIDVTEQNKLAHFNLGTALTAGGRVDEGVKQLRAAVAIDPNYTGAICNLAVALDESGHPEEAVVCYRRALELLPNSTSVMANLAWHYATQADVRMNNGAEAVRLAEQVVAAEQGSDARNLNVLGAAYAAAGQFDKAIEATNRSWANARRQNLAWLLAKIPAQLATYKAHRPWQEVHPPGGQQPGNSQEN